MLDYYIEPKDNDQNPITSPIVDTWYVMQRGVIIAKTSSLDLARRMVKHFSDFEEQIANALSVNSIKPVKFTDATGFEVVVVIEEALSFVEEEGWKRTDEKVLTPQPSSLVNPTIKKI